MDETRPRVELLGFDGCPNTPKMRAELAAALELLDGGGGGGGGVHRLEAGATGGGWAFVDIDQEALPAGDIRRGYPTPTVLVNRRDIFGLPVPEGPSMGCRMYPGGVPGAGEIAERIRGVVASGRWKK